MALIEGTKPGQIKTRDGVELPLRGWREIGQFLGRDESTARRWAEGRGMPVFRTSGGGRGVPVHAYASELEAWLRDEARRGGMDDHTPAVVESEDAGEDAGASGEPAPVERARDEPPTSRKLALIVGACLSLGFCLGTAATLGGVMLASHGQPETHAGVETAVPETARDLYLRGSFLWTRSTPSTIREAISVLNQAVAIHPDYAEAHAALAVSYVLAERYAVLSGWEAFPKAERAAGRAIALNRDLDLAQSALGFVEYRWHWDAEASFSRFERTLSEHPRSANALFWYANVLMFAGRSAEALPLIVKAEEIDPDSSAIRNLHAQILFLLGRTDASRDFLEEIAARDPAYPWPRYTLYFIALATGDYPAYLDNYAAFGEALGVARYREAADAGRRTLPDGTRAMAEAMAAVEIAHYGRGEALAYEVARHFAIAGRKEDALSWLRISRSRHEPHLSGLLAEPAFNGLRQETGFAELLAAIGLPTRQAVLQR